MSLTPEVASDVLANTVAVDKKREGGTIEMAMPIQVEQWSYTVCPLLKSQRCSIGWRSLGRNDVALRLLSLSLLGMGCMNSPIKLHLGRRFSIQQALKFRAVFSTKKTTWDWFSLSILRSSWTVCRGNTEVEVVGPSFGVFIIPTEAIKLVDFPCTHGWQELATKSA